MFPESGREEEDIEKEIEALSNELNSHTSRTFSLFSTKPRPITLHASTKALSINQNNVGTHTRDGHVPRNKLHEIERNTIVMMGDLMESKDVDGYVTQGGTEGNLMGLWIGRNMLREKNPELKEICILKTKLTHFSINKVSNLLDVPCKDVALNDVFQMDARHLKEVISSNARQGIIKYIIVATLGYHTTGVFDSISEIDTALRELQKEFGIETYVHIDAAIGGMVLPFVEGESFGFSNDFVQSITLDMHKNGFVPHTAGVFLCRKENQQWIEHTAPYLTYGVDDTFSTSRPAHAALSVWASITSLGREGFENIVGKQHELKNYFVDLLEKRVKGGRSRLISDQLSTVLAVSFGNDLSEEITRKYRLRRFRYEDDTYYTVSFMPHMTKESIEEFFDDLSLSM